MKKIGLIIFVVLCFLVMLLPFAAMPMASSQTTTENKELKEWPQWREEEGYNLSFLSDMGEYFQDHFAFRQELVTANALVYGKLFGASTTDQVIIGTDGWMYYTGTLEDYLSRSVMSDRKVFNAIHNLKLMRDYVEERGSQFILTIAPNKNSVYGQNMPYYYVKGSADNNYQKLKEALIRAEIPFVDLFPVFEEEEEVRYLARDSHWTNRGAVLVYNRIMQEISMAHETYETVPYEVRKEHLGDLTEMLYPLASELEENEYYQKEWSFSYANEVADNMDVWIETTNPEGENTLLMYRDSFGESLLPFFAEAFENAYFSRLVPYNLTNVDVYQPDYTVIERVERRISSFAEEHPIMQAPRKNVRQDGEYQTDTTCEVKADGGYYAVSGKIDPDFLGEEDEIFVRFSTEDGEEATYIPFYLSEESGEDNGYFMYLDQRLFPEKEILAEVLTGSAEECSVLYSGKQELMPGE